MHELSLDIKTIKVLNTLIEHSLSKNKLTNTNIINTSSNVNIIVAVKTIADRFNVEYSRGSGEH